MIHSQEDLIKNLAKTEQPAGDDSNGGGASVTKLPIRTLNEFKSKIHELEKEENSPSSTLKLQCPRVPKRLLYARGTKFAYYMPQLMSFGPYHHGKHNLQAGETLKLKLAATFFRESGVSADEIYDTIIQDIEVLRNCYSPQSTKEYKDEELSVMFLVDGCALLWYILCVCLGGDNYHHEEYGIRYQDLSRIHQDALLLENQLPYQLLHNHIMKIDSSELANDAWTVILQEFLGLSTDDSFFQEFFGIKEEPFLRKMKNYCYRMFLPINHNLNQKTEKESKSYCHLLDLYRKNFLGDERSYPMQTKTTIVKMGPGLVGDVKEQVMASFRNVKEMMAAGIRIKRSPTRHLRDISFHSNGITACLKIPPIAIDSSTKTLFLNLIAYEMSSDVPHDFISYLRFLDSLIDHDDDVKELQSSGILQNNLGTHEQVAEFFNTVSSNLESNFHAYKDVRVKIRKHLKNHYNSRLKMWMTQCLDTYFGSPWTIIAWVGAAFALFFTAVQTYFAVFHP